MFRVPVSGLVCLASWLFVAGSKKGGLQPKVAGTAVPGTSSPSAASLRRALRAVPQEPSGKVRRLWGETEAGFEGSGFEGSLGLGSCSAQQPKKVKPDIFNFGGLGVQVLGLKKKPKRFQGTTPAVPISRAEMSAFLG